MKNYHIPVLLQETLNALQIRPGERYIDATLGGGGHTREILNQRGIVLGIDQDEDAIKQVKKELKIEHGQLTIARGNFRNIDSIARENGFEKVAGILMDLGISSHHVDERSRGFSFLEDAPLDMRMDTRLGVTAADLVNALNKGELIELFTKYGEENFAKRIASHIIEKRKENPITSTGQLARIVAESYPVKNSKIHPATKVFQALRIAVNDELGVLREALPKAIELLDAHGRLVVISFHSLEDRIVKQSFIEFEEKGLGKIITPKSILPSDDEQEHNRRSRSAKMRFFEKQT